MPAAKLRLNFSALWAEVVPRRLGQTRCLDAKVMARE
jgi:hypothetical protein